MKNVRTHNNVYIALLDCLLVICSILFKAALIRTFPDAGLLAPFRPFVEGSLIRRLVGRAAEPVGERLCHSKVNFYIQVQVHLLYYHALIMIKLSSKPLRLGRKGRSHSLTITKHAKNQANYP